tara:strand:+ start:195 stop:737 length:543 start_codon:yes stop_codon:yes gene_type:complete
MKNAVITMIGCLICFGGGLYLGVSKVDEQADKWDVRYKEIDDKVSVFVDVSNPKTIRLYTNELRSILDNMGRLSKIVDKGQEIDETLDRILEGIIELEAQWDVTISNDLKMKETIDIINNHIVDTDSRVRSDLKVVLNKELEDIDLRINKQFDQIENDLRDIRNMLTQIENSKVGQKIFK